MVLTGFQGNSQFFCLVALWLGNKGFPLTSSLLPHFLTPPHLPPLSPFKMYSFFILCSEGPGLLGGGLSWARRVTYWECALEDYLAMISCCCFLVLIAADTSPFHFVIWNPSLSIPFFALVKMDLLPPISISNHSPIQSLGEEKHAQSSCPTLSALRPEAFWSLCFSLEWGGGGARKIAIRVQKVPVRGHGKHVD